MLRKLLIVGFLALGLCATALADNIGKSLPETEIEGLSNSPADSMDELAGRAILIEFFAYW